MNWIERDFAQTPNPPPPLQIMQYFKKNILFIYYYRSNTKILIGLIF